MLKFDLNCDMGESTHLWEYRIERDFALLAYITSMNLACGFHAGDPLTMHRLTEAAVKTGVAVGAHPGFSDRENFGRSVMLLSPEEVYDLVLYQLVVLEVYLKSNGARLHHVKPHGALYNMAAKDAALSDAICRAVKDYDPRAMIYGLSGSELTAAAERWGLTARSEVFADRTYQDDGTLTPRSQPNALLDNELDAVRQVLQMVEKGTVTAVSGKEIPVAADTICIHSDGAHALELAKAVRLALNKMN
jgi:UPF0271 protein